MAPIFISIALLALFAFPLARCAPAPQGLRGSPSLGGFSASNDLTTGDTNDIEYKLAPGQKEDAKIGYYLHFENNPSPQPIRGSKGGSEPGPRELKHYYNWKRGTDVLKAIFFWTKWKATSLHLQGLTILVLLTPNGRWVSISR